MIRTIFAALFIAAAIVRLEGVQSPFRHLAEHRLTLIESVP